MHAYPQQLADFVLDHWPEGASRVFERRALMEVLSSCFQASLTHEEGRPVRFRLVLGSVGDVTSRASEDQFLPLTLERPRELTPDNLRRLSPATPFHSSLIGADGQGSSWSIWGLVHSGAEWLAPSWGGRDRHLALGLPEVHVTGAGRLGVYAGPELVATLERGVIEATTTDVFTSGWLSALFRETRRRFATEHAALTRADDALVRWISQHMVRRAVFLIRQAGNGGMLLFAEPEFLIECARAKLPPLRSKYRLTEGPARQRYRTLMERLIRELERNAPEGVADLERFLGTETPEVTRAEQAIFELSRLIAGLAAVDGAVLLSKRFDLMGFGAEVSGELPYPDTVFQALDVDGERRAPEAANSVGTRHRAAYRFVTAHPSGLAVVVSHDGVVRFVANHGGDVVYWDQFLNW